MIIIIIITIIKTIIMNTWYLVYVRQYSKIFMHIYLFKSHKKTKGRNYISKKEVDFL